VKGISLQRGTIVVLSLDGSIVYVEDVQPTYAAVVALPEQPATRDDKQGVFTPGKVGAKKISPFSQPDREVAVPDLSPRNREFIGTYEQLRKDHGPHFVQRTPEEDAKMVRKETGERAPRGQGKRAQKRAAGPKYLQRCATCSEQPAHPNHDKGGHTFVPPTEATTPTDEAPAPTREPRRPKATASPSVVRYTLVSDDLSAARAQPRGDKFNDGNRSHRVVLALASLPAKTGTLDEVVAAMCADGKLPPANPPKVARRTLNQLRKPAFGSCVTTDGAAPDDDAQDDGE
jgi:hypothetical protein